MLCCAGGINACRTIARNVQCSSGTFPAAHCQNDRPCTQSEEPFCFIHGSHPFPDDSVISCLSLFHRNIHHNGAEQVRNLQIHDLSDITVGIFGSGQFFFKGMQAETIMNTLVQDSAETDIPFQNDNILHTGFSRRYSCRQPGRAAADNYQIYIFFRHCLYPFPPEILTLRRIW